MLSPPLPPMEALAVEALPDGEKWQYEPKWDGFRCIAFKDAAGVYLQSRNLKPLGRYFPEMVEALAAIQADRFVLDGELAVPVGDSLSFEDLQLRLHPAASRINKLARETPSIFIVFDLLAAEDGEALLDRPFAQRHAALQAFARKFFPAQGQVRASVSSTDIEQARAWIRQTSGGLDGVIAKDLTAEYRSGERMGIVKIKNIREADCVVGGFRYATSGKIVGSLLLGLYDEAGRLNHVGYTSSLSYAERKKLTPQMEALANRTASEFGFSGDAPGGPSRWATERTAEWTPVAIEQVVQVQYDHFSGGRFRHGTKIMRWRQDKDPRDCTYDQIPASGEKAMRLL